MAVRLVIRGWSGYIRTRCLSKAMAVKVNVDTYTDTIREKFKQWHKKSPKIHSSIILRVIFNGTLIVTRSRSDIAMLAMKMFVTVIIFFFLHITWQTRMFENKDRITKGPKATTSITVFSMELDLTNFVILFGVSNMFSNVSLVILFKCSSKNERSQSTMFADGWFYKGISVNRFFTSLFILSPSP